VRASWHRIPSGGMGSIYGDPMRIWVDPTSSPDGTVTQFVKGAEGITSLFI
jgi:hypothetical protein